MASAGSPEVEKAQATVRLQQLSEEVGRIAKVLAALSEHEAAAAEMAAMGAVTESAREPLDAGFIRSIIRVRRLRDHFFKSDLFADPAWDMLLDLMAARVEKQRVAVSSLCIAAAVPPTTALHWIKGLCDQGLFVRVADPEDGRRVFIELSSDTAARMEAYLRSAQRIGQGAARSGHVAESARPFSAPTGKSTDASNAALREAGARAAEVADNPVARSMLAAGLVTAAAALTADARVQKTVRDAGKGALDSAEAVSEGAGKIGAAIVTAATDAVKRLLQSEPAENAEVEISQGRALGVPLSQQVGMARLESYARPHPIESWAGPVLGAGGLEERLGIARSTLNDWRKRGAVIGILRGERKYYFPIEQFVDGRPLTGIGAVSRAVGDPKAAWLWLRQAHGGLDMATPLEVLKSGGVEAVVDVARRDFS